ARAAGRADEDLLARYGIPRSLGRLGGRRRGRLAAGGLTARRLAGCGLALHRLVGLADLGQDEDGGELGDEEAPANREEDPEPVAGKPGTRSRDDERG